VVDLAHQQRALGGERLEAVARLAHLRFRRLLGASHAHGVDRARQRRLQKKDELALDVLDDIVERAGLERRDRHAAVLRAGDDHDRRVVVERVDAVERLDAGQAGHVEVEGDDVDVGMRGERREAAFAARLVDDLDAIAAEPAPDQSAQPFVIVDIEDLARHGPVCVQSGEGTWITEKNRPS